MQTILSKNGKNYIMQTILEKQKNYPARLKKTVGSRGPQSLYCHIWLYIMMGQTTQDSQLNYLSICTTATPFNLPQDSNINSAKFSHFAPTKKQKKKILKPNCKLVSFGNESYITPNLCWIVNDFMKVQNFLWHLVEHFL